MKLNTEKLKFVIDILDDCLVEKLHNLKLTKAYSLSDLKQSRISSIEKEVDLLYKLRNEFRIELTYKTLEENEMELENLINKVQQLIDDDKLDGSEVPDLDKCARELQILTELYAAVKIKEDM